MICTRCKYEGEEKYFTKLNRGKDGSKGLCRKCKSTADSEYRKGYKEKTERLECFELSPDMLERNMFEKPRIGVLSLERFIDRKSTKDIPYENLPNSGLFAILNELKEPWEFTKARQINNYEVILCSLTSVYDVVNLIYTIERFAPVGINPPIIVGGFGVVNVKLISKYVDVAVFGRAEGQIQKILSGDMLPNVWRKEDDPDFKKTYTMRKPVYLLPGEENVGCKHKCAYCFYSWTRGNFDKDKSYAQATGKGLIVPEADWNAIHLEKGGRHITAWDGWSDETRSKVRKPVTDQNIRDKLTEILEDGPGEAINLKVYMVTGYPWETVESVQGDIEQVKDMLSGVDRPGKQKVTLTFKINPFGPEPLTPLQYEAANIYTNWSCLDRAVYNGQSLKAFILPMIDSPYKLMTRVFIHRAESEDLELFKCICFSRKLQLMPAGLRVQWLTKHDYINHEMFGRITEEEAAFGYLDRE